METPAAAAIQTSTPIRTRQMITADASSEVPNRIEVIKAGVWPASSVKGPLEITVNDLFEFKKNFDAGIGLPKGLNKLPIDYSHESWSKAAGWMTSLEVVGDTLFADVTWTPAGKQALLDEEFKCFSPSFWPGCLGMWQDPEDADITARNVLVGAGLTNIPFFKDLQSITASTSSDNGGKNTNVIYIQADNKKELPMSLDEIRVKEASAINADERTFLEEHKEELSADEQTKFGLTTASAEDANKNNKQEGHVADPEQAAIMADIQSGKKLVVEASTFNKMQEDIDGMKREKIEASVKTHIARGAIKADQLETWTTRILADSSLADDLAALPDNPALAGETGSSSAGQNVTTDAQQELHTAVTEKIQAAADQNKQLSYSAARKEVLASNKELADRVKEEQES